MSQQLIEQIEAAETKEDLEPFAKQLGVKIDKRTGLETVRANLLEAAEGDQDGDKEGDKEGDSGTQEKRQDKEDKKASTKASKGKQRKLKSTKNGRIFTWTAALAKLGHMKEV